MRPRPRRRLVSVSVGVLALGALGIATAAPVPAEPITDTDETIETLRREAERAADAYFEALAQAQELEAQINAIEAKLPELEAQRRELRLAAEERAVAAYKRRGARLSALISAGDALTVLRRNRLLDGLNAADNKTFDELSRVSDKLDGQREQLQEARASLDSTLQALETQGDAIDAKLRAAEDRRRRLAAEQAAAAAPSGSGSAPIAPGPGPSVPYIGTPGTHPQHNHPFLVCTRRIESGGNYRAYNPAGPYMGAYQFLQSTWNSTANHAGRPGLIGVRPDHANVYDQDDMAWTLYQWQGSRPWGGRCD